MDFGTDIAPDWNEETQQPKTPLPYIDLPADTDMVHSTKMNRGNQAFVKKETNEAPAPTFNDTPSKLALKSGNTHQL